MPTAAFFDLDRTLLPVGSGPVISDALASVGLGTSIPGTKALFRLFDVLGENRTSMILARQAPRAARGWPRTVVQEAARRAAPLLLERVQPYARTLIAAHHARGEQVVLATTSPADLVTPFAEALGIDAVIATRYGHVDGVYDGTFDGDFVWGPGKLRAVRAWASHHGVDLAASTGYSDSWFDAPLLNEVGYPVAVNPDPRLLILATARGWPIRYLDAPPGVAKVLGREAQHVLMPFLRAPNPFADIRVTGIEHLPSEGPVIVAANHRSYFDPFVIGHLLATVGRPARFLAKRELFETPLVKEAVAGIGTIPVDRGTGSDAPLAAAEEALAAGEVVVILPQGTIPRGEAFFAPRLHGRPGVARLAKATGAPVIPVGLWGSERVWPRAGRAPRPVAPWARPTVTLAVGPPVALVGRSEQRDTARVMDAIMALLPAEARTPRQPTPEELAATMPRSAASRP